MLGHPLLGGEAVGKSPGRAPTEARKGQASVCCCLRCYRERVGRVRLGGQAGPRPMVCTADALCSPDCRPLCRLLPTGNDVESTSSPFWKMPGCK